MLLHFTLIASQGVGANGVLNIQFLGHISNSKLEFAKKPKIKIDSSQKPYI